MSEKASVIIIGAGPAGLAAAYQLIKLGHPVTLIESTNQVGGMSRSLDMFGQIVDCGPHRFFTSDKIVNDFFHDIVGDNFTVVNRLTRIYYRNKFFDYPLKIGNVFRNISIFELTHILFSYFWIRIFPNKSVKTFEDWVTNKFGEKLFGMFFKSYTEKLWGISCSQIDADWASQRIKKLSLWEALISSIKGNKNNKHKTLVDVFAYPHKGTGAIYNEIARRFEKLGGKILFGQKIERFMEQDSKITEIITQNGESFKADWIVSTMPMTSLIQGLSNVPQQILDYTRKLYFRNTTLVYLEINSNQLFPDNWIYIHSPEVTHGRITNFRNWCPTLTNGKSTSILCLEIWSFDSDPLWQKSDEELSQLAHRELLMLNLISNNDLVLNSKVIKIPKCYPVYETGYMENLNPIIDYLNTISNLKLIGRYGSFKYNNQDHSILMGLLLAKEINTGINQNLWDINTDSDYQESTEFNLSGYS
ncbi:MAG: FAD-dependent oxidoreductase [Bacteroidia bacterium]|nr:FAD-dependent oxidoreductase [Bacteroidia bacterium]